VGSPQAGRDQSDVPLWTLEEASAWFAESGIPIETERLRLIIRALKWKPAGATPSGQAGGRGQARYPIADLMKLHAAVAPWIVAQGPMAGMEPDPGADTDSYYGGLDAQQGRITPVDLPG
jgi:hypothetical protein